MTTLEIRLKAITIIDTIITLKTNVRNGCYSDSRELESNMLRLEGIKTWAIENDQIAEIKHYFASKNFGHTKQFAASELAIYFNN